MNWINKNRFLEGERVKGLFFGVPYTGIVILSRPHDVYPTKIEMTVKFDEVLDCGETWGKRETGIISVFYYPEIHTIEAERKQ